ncbi:hypothetical protein ACE1AT_01590 [Pelatocladus sp. BLCC-F211]|uniref:hypothetical protein n=1 Tax=Pelatocladus sp. BLCC-F211 TaxID=3342752 RepID=UPI0035B7A948
MINNSRHFQKWVLHPLALGLIVTGAIACQSQSPLKASSLPTSSISSQKSFSQNQAIYRSDRYGFQFSYSPKGFVVDDKAYKPTSNDNILSVVEIWTQQHAKEIRSGAYEGGTEYPANVSVRVASNPRKLSLQKWVEQSNQFGITRTFKNTKIAGRNAFAFQSSGLYENENLVFSHPKNSNIIIISFGKTNYGNHDAIYKKAFDQVLSSFKFVAR